MYSSDLCHEQDGIYPGVRHGRTLVPVHFAHLSHVRRSMPTLGFNKKVDDERHRLESDHGRQLQPSAWAVLSRHESGPVGWGVSVTRLSLEIRRRQSSLPHLFLGPH